MKPKSHKVVEFRPEHDVTSLTEKYHHPIYQHVHYNKDGFIEATDGHFAVRVPIRKEEVENSLGEEKGKLQATTEYDAIIPVAVLKQAFRMSCETFYFATDGRIDGPKVGKFFDFESGVTVSAQLVEGQFPNIISRIPTKEPKARIRLSARLLKTLADYFHKHGTSLTFEFYSETEPVKITGVLDNGNTVIGALMPMHLEPQKPEKETNERES